MNKVCTKCDKEKDLDEFHKLAQGKFGVHPRCKLCRSSDMSDYHSLNKDVVNAKHRERRKGGAYYRLYKYGLTEEQYEAIKLSQGSLCAICKKEKNLVVDHCHSTGKIRGLLCTTCNTGLGKFQDSPDRLQDAINYLVECLSG